MGLQQPCATDCKLVNGLQVSADAAVTTSSDLPHGDKSNAVEPGIDAAHSTGVPAPPIAQVCTEVLDVFLGTFVTPWNRSTLLLQGLEPGLFREHCLDVQVIQPNSQLCVGQESSCRNAARACDARRREVQGRAADHFLPHVPPVPARRRTRRQT